MKVSRKREYIRGWKPDSFSPPDGTSGTRALPDLQSSWCQSARPFWANSVVGSSVVTFGQGPWTRLPPVLFPLSSELQSRSAPSTRIPLEFIHGYVSTRFSTRNSSRAQDRQARGRHGLRVHRAGDFAFDKHRPLISGQDSA